MWESDQVLDEQFSSDSSEQSKTRVRESLAELETRVNEMNAKKLAENLKEEEEGKRIIAEFLNEESDSEPTNKKVDSSAAQEARSDQQTSTKQEKITSEIDSLLEEISKETSEPSKENEVSNSRPS